MAIIKNPLTIVQTGGEEPTTGQYLVQVIDYDGTVLKSANLDTGATFTLPNAPTHEKLIFQEWSSPVTISNNSITVVDSDITIGVTYKTASGLTEIDITLTKVTGLTVTCKMTGQKNWGDGTTDSSTTHTYADYGEYTITCNGTLLVGYIFGQSTIINNYYCTAVRVGELVTNFASNAFRNCASISSISIPNSILAIGSSAFDGCNSLKSITIPESIPALTSDMFYNCSNLISIAIPASIVSGGISKFQNCINLTSITIPTNQRIISDSEFRNCDNLISVTIPANVTEIGNYAFYNCRRLQAINFSENSQLQTIDESAFQLCTNLTTITIPEGVTEIGLSAFASCVSITKYDFTSATSVPTLTSNAFFNINDICKIVVPDTLYDEWISATNWVTYANYIYKASEV